MSTASNAPGNLPSPSQSFAAFRHPGFRVYLLGNALAMMADSVEHVITYWVAFQKFHSPTLGGFAMLSHWLPFLLFSTLAGALADRFDPRRLVQIGMALFMFCSIAWSRDLDRRELTRASETVPRDRICAARGSNTSEPNETNAMFTKVAPGVVAPR